jgi:bisphosphoglycerate-independent phosphoglycerate mutase (AlkP superfamily)
LKRKFDKSCKIDYVGHGTIDEKSYVIDREKAIERINKNFENFLYGDKIKSTDIIFLNANNVVPRKRIDLTIKAFLSFHATLE